MSTARWRKNTSVIARLTDNPYQFPFLQAVRLLERSAVYEKDTEQNRAAFNHQPVAQFTPPSSEAVRFRTNHALHFQSAEISHLHTRQTSKNNKRWELSVNFMGLTGSQGVLPYHYTELVLKRLKLKDKSISNFLDLFNHRTISLFYQASCKYRLPLEYERKKLNPPVKRKHDDHSQVLMSLIGLGTPGLQNRLGIRDETLFYFGGLLSQQIRTTTGLKQILKSYFAIPVEVREFIGQWQELIDDVRTRLPGREFPRGQNNCLGRSVMLGKKGWFAQGKINIVLGPLDREQLQLFAPGSRSLRSLNELIQFYAGMEYDYDIVIRVKRRDLPDKIQLGGKNRPMIGWNTWLSNKGPQASRKDDIIEIRISANNINQ